MSDTTISLKGSLEIGGSLCVSSCDGDSRAILALGEGCGCNGLTYGQLINQVSRISTAGIPGQVYAPVLAVSDYTSLEFLYLHSDSLIYARIGATNPRLIGLGSPSSSLNGQTMTVLLVNGDGAATTTNSFVVTFGPSDTAIATIAATINAASVSAIGSSIASVVGGLLTITGPGKGSRAQMVLTGAAAGFLGFSLANSVAVGGGNVFPVNGDALLQLVQPNTQGPVSLELSGASKVSLVVAGR